MGAADRQHLVQASAFQHLRGYWINLLRVKKTGVLNRHLHPAPVFGLVLRGSWRYLEHDWTAHEG